MIDDESTLGAILVRLEWVSQEQVDKALAAGSGRLGQRLIDTGAIDDDALQKALDIQQKLRDGLPALGELAVLHEVTKNASATAKQVSKAIADKRKRKRERGERTDVFLIPLELQMRRG